MCLAQALELTHKHIRLHKQTYMLTLTHRPGECNISSHTCTHSAKWMYATMCEVCHIHQRCYTELPTILASGIRNDEYKQKQTKKKPNTKLVSVRPTNLPQCFPFNSVWHDRIYEIQRISLLFHHHLCAPLSTWASGAQCIRAFAFPAFATSFNTRHYCILTQWPQIDSTIFLLFFFSFLVRYRCCCSLLIATDSMPAVLCLCVCMCARAFATLQADLGWMNLLQRPVACVRIIHLIGADIATHALLHMHCE